MIPAGPAAPHLRGQAAGGRAQSGGLQHPEGVHAAPCFEASRWGDLDQPSRWAKDIKGEV